LSRPVRPTARRSSSFTASRSSGGRGAGSFRAVAPDLRGYHRSDKPRGLGAYRLDRLAGDLRALIDDLGPAPCPVVGHDWGGALAWWGALVFPERISRLVILNAPHPGVLRRALLRDPDQRRRSRYMFLFQLPWWPERKLGRDGCRLVRKTFERTSRPGTFTPAELDRYAAAAALPGALRGMLAWYRAGLWRPAPRPPHRRVEPPLRLLWGDADRALSPALVEPSAARCREAEVVPLEGASHWVQHEEPERVSALLLDFLAREPVRSSRPAPP
jgi:pimeloyl-ACP methyl ester carboxylesterase